MAALDSKSSQEAKSKRKKVDWDALRARSLQPGGFGADRVDIWPQLLNVWKQKATKRDSEEQDTSISQDTRSHQDERQIGLDTDRSFVLYPLDPRYDKETLQAELHTLLVSLFHKRPRLSYFQGYHDIATVIFLTLPSELQLESLEKLSLHRVRDSMGSGLEPVLGLLRVTKNLLRLADPDYATILEQTAPLPFHALSNLLTLFSHDVPTLPLIQHVFDYLLCRPPIFVVYLATTIILSRKKEVIRLQEEDEEGMIHSLLSSLPALSDDVDDPPPPPDTLRCTEEPSSPNGSEDDDRRFPSEDTSTAVGSEEGEALKLDSEGDTGPQSGTVADAVRSERLSLLNNASLKPTTSEYIPASPTTLIEEVATADVRPSPATASDVEQDVHTKNSLSDESSPLLVSASSTRSTGSSTPVSLSEENASTAASSSTTPDPPPHPHYEDVSLLTLRTVEPNLADVSANDSVLSEAPSKGVSALGYEEAGKHDGEDDAVETAQGGAAQDGGSKGVESGVVREMGTLAGAEEEAEHIHEQATTEDRSQPTTIQHLEVVEAQTERNPTSPSTEQAESQDLHQHQQLNSRSELQDGEREKRRPTNTAIPLVELLKQADALHASYPPSHADLRLSSIMGPQSVVYTWSENVKDLPDDDEAEAMVSHPELVVYPYVEEPPEGDEETEEEVEEEKSSGWGLRRRNKGKERAKPNSPKKSRSNGLEGKRRRRKLRKSPFTRIEKRTMVAGTVLVLGVAMAVYGIKMRNSPGHGGSAGLFRSFADAQGHANVNGRELKRLGGWVGGALVGMSEKILHGLASGGGGGAPAP